MTTTQSKRRPYPNDHTAIVGMVDNHGFAEVVRALADQARRRSICHGESQRQIHKNISYLLDDCAEAISKATSNFPTLGAQTRD